MFRAWSSVRAAGVNNNGSKAQREQLQRAKHADSPFVWVGRRTSPSSYGAESDGRQTSFKTSASRTPGNGAIALIASVACPFLSCAAPLSATMIGAGDVQSGATSAGAKV